MNSNRGAKGSVNDRIISFLYRKRYLEYLKKKEYYTKEQREKVKEYLKKIKEFDIDENVSVLDADDKKILEDVYGNLQVEDIFESPERDVINQDIEKKEGYEDIIQIKNIPEPSNSSSDTNLDELIAAGDKISEFDPYTEEYDFDKYDYYEIIEKHKGIENLQDNEVIDVEKEEKKLDDEQIILEEVTEFIDESVEELDEIKTELKSIKNSIEDIHTENDSIELEEKFNKVKEKLENLKNKYDIMKEKYEFEDYEILDNLTLIEAIDDYKDKASLEELELMVDACKYEIEAIDGIEIEEEKKVGIGEEVTQKHKIIKQRDNDFKEKK